MTDARDVDLQRALALSAVPVPPEIDARILDAASRRRARRRWPLAAAGALMAAATALFFAFRPAPAQARDVNHDGRVDVLDAYRLARAVEAGETAPRWDLNRDGRVDRADVDGIMTALVSLQ